MTKFPMLLSAPGRDNPCRNTRFGTKGATHKQAKQCVGIRAGDNRHNFKLANVRRTPLNRSKKRRLTHRHSEQGVVVG